MKFFLKRRERQRQKQKKHQDMYRTNSNYLTCVIRIIEGKGEKWV